MSRSLAFIFALAAWTVLALPAAPFAAAAGLDPARLEAARAASAEFMAMAAGARSSGEPPRLTDPAARPLIEAVFYSDDLAKLPALPFSANVPIGERMRIGLQAALVYILAGTGLPQGREAPDDPALKSEIAANVARFAPEIGLFYDLRITVQAATLQTVFDLLDTMGPSRRMQPNVVRGVAQVRRGAAEAVTGVLETMADARMSDAWRRDRLVRLSLLAPKLPGFLPEEQAAELAALARKAAEAASDAEVAAGLRGLARTLGDETGTPR